MDLGLAGRVYVVSGGSRGLGRATAEALVAEGAQVVLGARDEAAVERAAQELGGRAHAVGVTADLGRAAAAQRLVEAAHTAYGGLDGALVSVGGPPPGAALDTEEEAWRAAFESVFLGALRLTRQVAGAVGADGGSIALVLSSSVRTPIPGLAVSNGLRPGLAGLVKTLANELGPRGIRVNGLLPGRIATDRTDRDRPGQRRPGRGRRRAEAAHPAGAVRAAGRVRPGGRVRALPRGVLRDRLDGHRGRRHDPYLVTGAVTRTGDRTGVRCRGGRRLALELGAVELGVQPAGREQLAVRAGLDHPAGVDHEDLVGVAHGGQPVRDDQRGAAVQRGGQRPLHGHLGLGVEVGGRLVEDHDRRAP